MPRFSTILFLISALCVVVALSVGCGQRPVRQVCSVEGTVTYQGKPVTGGFVVFTNLQAGITQSAQLQADGRYRIPEIPVGDYQVHLGDPPPPGPEEAEAGTGRASLNVPEKYKSAATSGLTAKLSAGKNVCDFKLD